MLTDAMSLLQKAKSGMGIPDWNASMVDIYLRKLLWVYCPGHAGVKESDRADLLAGKTTLTSGLILGRSEDTQTGQIYASEKIHCLSDANRLVQVSVIVIISATLQMPEDTQRVTKSSILM